MLNCRSAIGQLSSCDPMLNSCWSIAPCIEPARPVSVLAWLLLINTEYYNIIEERPRSWTHRVILALAPRQQRNDLFTDLFNIVN